VPSGQVVGAPPPRHSTLHCETFVHATWQVLVHSASHDETLLQRIVLPAPARTPQLETLSQS
jgi:hypothetical protein